MNYQQLNDKFEWVLHEGQMDSGVTYVYVAKKPITRLVGSSDILYAGKTEQAMRVRYEQETKTKNSPRNTQQTNIRMTHILDKFGDKNYKCFFVKKLELKLSGTPMSAFLDKLKTWDKQFWLKLTDANVGGTLEVPIEKFLLVYYADEHLELPPLNNRM